MYSYLIQAKVDTADYAWFTYRASKPAIVDFRGSPVAINSGTRFGVRPSAQGDFLRLVLPDEPTKVITLDVTAAQALADGVGVD